MSQFFKDLSEKSDREKRTLTELLVRFKSLTCLWDTSDKFYTHKESRNEALNILLDIWKKCDSSATVSDVKRKLEHTRTTYRRERKKVENSKAIATDPEHIYRPTLWYYKYLNFLYDEQVSTTSTKDKESVVTENDNSDEESRSISDSYRSIPTVSVKIEEASPEELDLTLEEGDNDQDSEVYQETIEPISNTYKPALERTNESRRRNTNYREKRDSANAFGILISAEINELPRLQRCLAEKLMGEVLFYAKMDRLTLDTNINLEDIGHTSRQPQKSDQKSSQSSGTKRRRLSSDNASDIYLIVPEQTE